MSVNFYQTTLRHFLVDKTLQLESSFQQWYHRFIFRALLTDCFFCSVRVHLTLKMEAVRSSEMSVNFYKTIRRQVPKDDSLHSDHCENLKCNRNISSFVNQSRSEIYLVHFSFYLPAWLTFFKPEDGCDIFIRNVGEILSDTRCYSPEDITRSCFLQFWEISLSDFRFRNRSVLLAA
jgi:hypothetical protein